MSMRKQLVAIILAIVAVGLFGVVAGVYLGGANENPQSTLTASIGVSKTEVKAFEITYNNSTYRCFLIDSVGSFGSNVWCENLSKSRR